MNVRCAEKKLERETVNVGHIEQSKRFLKIEKFVQNERVDVCLQIKEKEGKSKKDAGKSEVKSSKPNPDILITETTSCIHSKNKYVDQISTGNNKTSYPEHADYIKDFINKFSQQNWKLGGQSPWKIVRSDIMKGQRECQVYASIAMFMDIVRRKMGEASKANYFKNIEPSEIKYISNQIKDHILRHIYKFVYPTIQSQEDKEFYDICRDLDWIKPEMLEIKKIYVNQLGLAERNIKKLEEARSVNEKLDCVKRAHATMNNTIKFSSGKDSEAGQDEITPIFQYIIIKAQPKRIFSDINYIKCFLEDSELKGQQGFLVTQLISATTFIKKITFSHLKVTKEFFDENVERSKKRRIEQKLSM